MKPRVSIFLATLLLVAIPPSSLCAHEIDSTFAFREIFLPPGLPSVAARFDEGAVLWNPAGIAMSETYYLGYAWKGTYLEDDRKVSTHFLLTKAHGFGLGVTRDDYAEGVKTTTIFALAPKVTNRLGLGVTAKWKGGFNFDCGTLATVGKRVSFGLVGRNLREKKNVRRYYEGALAVYGYRGRLTVFFDIIKEDSPWRDEIGYGGGLQARLQHGITPCVSYFTDGSDNDTVRASVSFWSTANIIEGEYSTSSDDWRTFSGRITSKNP